MVTKVTFVGQGFTRKPPKYERFIRPTGLRMTKASILASHFPFPHSLTCTPAFVTPNLKPAVFFQAHVTHPELKATFQLNILGVKKNPNGQMYTGLGVVTRGTVIEVDVSELGLVTPAGKVVWGKYAQVTNNPENDGCINAVLLV